MKVSRSVAFVAALILGLIFLGFPRGSYTKTDVGPSCELCQDFREITIVERRLGFPLVWKISIEKDGSFQEGEFSQIGKAVIDFVAGASIILIPTGVITVMRRKK